MKVKIADKNWLPALRYFSMVKGGIFTNQKKKDKNNRTTICKTNFSFRKWDRIGVVH